MVSEPELRDTPIERLLAHSVGDHRRHYDTRSLFSLVPPLVLGGALATSSADRWVRQTWKDDIRSDISDDLSKVFRQFGDAAQPRWSMPAYALVMAGTDYSGYAEQDSVIATWAERSLRANILGGPQQLAFCYLLGSGRPEDGPSTWNPWKDNNGASGHSFYGAVPILTAARMTESTGWRYGLYTLSLLPAWSRVNDDRHYLSQAVIGWSLAWLATGTVAESESDKGALSITPLLTPDGGYVMVNWNF